MRDACAGCGRRASDEYASSADAQAAINAKHANSIRPLATFMESGNARFAGFLFFCAAMPHRLKPRA